MVRQIADEEGLPPEYCDIETSGTEVPIPVEKELLNDDQTYTRKIERGRTICDILEHGSAREDTLSRRRTTGKRSNRKNMPMRNLSNTELRIWQQHLLDNISSPSDREVIWVIGQKGNDGKTWFRE